MISWEGGLQRETRRWQRIGKDAQDDLTNLTLSNLPYASAEDLIMQTTHRGGFRIKLANSDVTVELTPFYMLKLKDMHIQYYRWYLKFGMVVFVAAPGDAPFFCVIPDPRTGYFVARHSISHKVEVGWRFHETDKNGMPPEPYPDATARVLVFPGHDPDIGSGQPFRSRLAPLLPLHSMQLETRNNMQDSEYMAAHPPMVTAFSTGSGAAMNSLDRQQTQHDITVNAITATRNGISTGAQFRLDLVGQTMAEEALHSTALESYLPSHVAKVGYDTRGKRVMVRRSEVWARRIPLPAGRTISSVQMPVLISDWTDRERFFTETLFRAFGLPTSRMAARFKRSSQSSGNMDSGSASDDMQQMRDTISGAREIIEIAFGFMYEQITYHHTKQALYNTGQQRTRAIDGKISTLQEYLSFLVKTNQVESEPMFAAMKELKEYRENLEIEREINERVALIVSEGHRQNIMVDSEVVYKHLKDLYYLQMSKRDEERSANEKIEKYRRVSLEFLQPPAVDAHILMQLARDGMFNSTEASNLFAASIGLSESSKARALAGTMFMSHETAERLRLDRRKMDDDKIIQLEKLKLEEKKIKISERQMELAAAAAESEPKEGQKRAGGSKSSDKSTKKQKK